MTKLVSNTVAILLFTASTVSLAQSALDGSRFSTDRARFISDPCYGTLTHANACAAGMELIGQGSHSGTCCQVKPLTLEQLLQLNQDPLSVMLSQRLEKLTTVGEVRNLYPHNLDSKKLKNNRLVIAEYNVSRDGDRAAIETLLQGPDAVLKSDFIKTRTKDEFERHPEKFETLAQDLSRLSEADVIFLSETDNDTCRSGFSDDARDYAIAAKMNYAWMPEFVEMGVKFVSVPTQKNVKCDHTSVRNMTGNAVLSRYPIVDMKFASFMEKDGTPLCHDWHQDLAEPRRGARGYMIVTINAPGVGMIKAISTHLENKTSPRCRQQQLKQIGMTLKKDNVTEPLIFGGDLNTISSGNSVLNGHFGGFISTDSGTVNVLRKEMGFSVSGANDKIETFRALPIRSVLPFVVNPWLRLDWLAVKSGKINGAKVSLRAENPRTLKAVSQIFKHGASDHFPIVTDVVIEVGSTTADPLEAAGDDAGE